MGKLSHGKSATPHACNVVIVHYLPFSYHMILVHLTLYCWKMIELTGIVITIMSLSDQNRNIDMCVHPFGQFLIWVKFCKIKS